jgi:hypothetical protein
LHSSGGGHASGLLCFLGLKLPVKISMMRVVDRDRKTFAQKSTPSWPKVQQPFSLPSATPPASLLQVQL